MSNLAREKKQEMSQEQIQKYADRYRFLKEFASSDDADIIYGMVPEDWDAYIDARIEEVKQEGDWFTVDPNC